MSNPRPEPVTAPQITTAAITVVTTALALGAAFGLHVTAEQQTAVLATLAALAGFAGPALAVYHAFRSRAQVTPLADPKDDLGRALVPDVTPGAGR